MGLFYSVEGIGSFMGIALLDLVAPFWLNSMTDYGDINNNHLDFYLYFLGCIQFITFMTFCGILYVQRFSLRLIPMAPRETNGLVNDRTEELNNPTSTGSRVEPGGTRFDDDVSFIQEESAPNAETRPLI